MSSRLQLWRNPDFLKLWSGQTISEIGSRITREGLPLTAILTLGVSPWQMGLLTAAGALPILLFSLGAGVWADRVRRRPLMVWADVLRAGLLATVPIAALWGSLNLELLFAVTLLAGTFSVLFDVAYQTYLPSLLPRDQLVEGASKLALTASIAEIAGPGLTGLLIKLLTAPIAIALDAASFLVSAVCVAWIRQPEPRPEPSEPEPILAEASAGLREIWNNPVLRALGCRAVTLHLSFGFVGPIYLLRAVRDFNLSPFALGLIVALGGFGNLLGALLAEPVYKRLGIRTALLGSSAVLGIAILAIAIPAGPGWVAVAALCFQQLLGDSSYVISSVNETSLRLQIAPPAILGRVNASMHLLSRGVYPIGAIAGGLVAEWMGVRTTLLLAGLGVLGSTLWLLAVKRWPAPATPA